MLPAGLLKNRRDWLAAAAGQTIRFNLQYLHVSCKCVYAHVLHGCVLVCVLLLLIIASLKRHSNKEKVAKKATRRRKREERAGGCWGQLAGMGPGAGGS